MFKGQNIPDLLIDLESIRLEFPTLLEDRIHYVGSTTIMDKVTKAKITGGYNGNYLQDYTVTIRAH